MKRVRVCIFILMAVVAVSFFSLCRVSRGGSSLSAGIDKALSEYRLTGSLPKTLTADLNAEWEGYRKSIAYAENTDDLNAISLLFCELENAADKDDFVKTCELIKTSLNLLWENEKPCLSTVF